MKFIWGVIVGFVSAHLVSRIIARMLYDIRKGLGMNER